MFRSILNRLLLLGYLLIVGNLVANAQVRYVRATGTNTNPATATSWATATSNLQGAINSLTATGGQVWVAAGTYKPTTTTNRDVSFSMKNRVAIYGGFRGTETTLSQRPTINVTTPSSATLSGDIGTLNDSTDNSYHVVDNMKLDNTAIMDGFVITGGNAEGGTNDGGGMNNFLSNPTVNNCHFINNTAGRNGGGLNSYSNTRPILVNCSFINNTSQSGGGMAHTDESNNNQTSVLSLINCVFSGNHAYTGGGTFVFPQINTVLNATLTNCVFTGNSASYGGAMSNNYTSATLLNCSFVANSASKTGSGLEDYFSSTTLINTIFWGNVGESTFQSNSTRPVATYSLFDSQVRFYSGSNNLITDTSPFASTSSLQLTDCSVAVNAGNPASVTATSGPYGATTLPQRDLNGNPRIYGSRVDIGAYEHQSEPLLITTDVQSGTVAPNQYVLLSATVTGAANVSYNWIAPAGGILAGSTNSSAATARVTAPGKYTFTVVVTSSECSRAATVVVSSPPTISNFILTSGTVCAGRLANFTARVSNVTEPYSYTLTNGADINRQDFSSATTLSQNVTIGPAAGPQSFTLTVSSGGASTSSIITPTINPVPTVSISPAAPTTTAAQSTTLTASGASSYTWSTGQTGNRLVVSPGRSTVYSVIGTTDGCSSVASTTVSIPASVPTVSLTNTGAGSCVSVASLSVNTSATIRRVDWYRDNTLVSTSLPQTARAGVTVIGNNGQGAALNQLTSPSGIFVEATGTIYVTDRENNRVMKWFPGATSGVVVAGGNGPGLGANQLNRPSGLFVDASGAIYIADEYNHRVQKWYPGATSGVTVAGGNLFGAAPFQLDGPTGVFVDASGMVYVADLGNNRVQRWAPGATSGVTVAGGNGRGLMPQQLDQPTGLWVDNAGAVYVTDRWNARVQKWDAGSGAGTTLTGGYLSGPAAYQLSLPSGLFVDASGTLYIADSGNDRIQKWAPGATSGVTVAGGNGEGAAASQLNNPIGVFVDAYGAIYVTDQNNNRVQKWATDEISSTYIPTAAGNYKAIITDSYGFTATTNTLPITALSVAISPASPSITVGQSVTLTASGASSYIWSTGQSDNSLLVTPTSPTLYSVTGTTGVCSATASVQVVVLPSVSLINTAGGNCISGASLSVVSSSPISQLDWYNGTTLLTTTLPQAVTAGVTVAGGNSSGAAASQFNSSIALSVDASGAVYVADQNNNRVQKWAPGATAGVTVAGGNGRGSGANQLNEPYGVQVDATGSVYVADWSNHRVMKWAPGTTSGVVVAGGNGPGSAANQLAGANSVYIDASGAVYVAEWNNHRVTKWAPGATSGVVVAGGNGQGAGANQFNFPSSAYVDASGAVYVTDQGNNRVMKWAPGATSGVTVAGGNGRGMGANQLNSPASVWVDTYGAIYVADIFNHRIQKFPATSTSATAGTTVAGGNGSGAAANQLSQPYGVIVTGTGAIYVADRNNHRIQKWESARVTPTIIPNAAGSYTAKVTDPYGNTTTTNSVILAEPPTASISPASATVIQGQTARFVVSTNGSGVMYQWQIDAGSGFVNLANDAIYSGVNSATLIMENTTTALTGYTYRAIVGSGVCSVTSNSATLTVDPLKADLTVLLYAKPSLLYGNSQVNVVVDVVELNGLASTGLITLKITQDSKLILSMPATATMVGGRSVSNNVWSLSGPSNGYYVLTTNQGVGAGDKLSVGLLGNFVPGASTGQLTVSGTVLLSGGSEQRVANNVDADKLEYFQQ